ncbi:MAG TPA: hypothetical protein VG712_05465, partial [Gemmatimonadales bacterium]|nr:hypothetical protein [Gemmatimonadales bacterium]
ELGAAMEQRFRRDVLGSREVVRRLPNAPERIRAWLPEPQARPTPPAERVSHHTTFRERRKRAVVTLYSVAAGASRSILLPILAAVALLGLTAFFLPRVVAALTTLAALWLAQSAARQLRLRRGSPPQR